MLLFIFAAVTATVGYFVLKSKRSLSHILLEIKYEAQFQLVGARAVVDDHIRRKYNRLGQLPVRTGEVAVITGGARGIGVEIIKVLLKCGIKVVMGVRKPEAARKVVQAMKKEGLPDNVDIFELDVASLKSIKAFAKIVSAAYPEINLLINNAGIMFGDFSMTEDGFESQLATNYLGHFYLTHLLMPNLKNAGEKMDTTCARIVNVSSCAHFPAEIFFDDMNMKTDYISSAAYAQSKLAQIMYARHLNIVLENEEAKVKVYSVHPGVVNTELFNNSPIGKHAPWIMKLFFKTAKEGAVSILYTCLSPKVEFRGGLYVSNCRQGLTNDFSKDERMQKKLFETTCEMLKIKKYGHVEAQ